MKFSLNTNKHIISGIISLDRLRGANAQTCITTCNKNDKPEFSQTASKIIIIKVKA